MKLNGIGLQALLADLESELKQERKCCHESDSEEELMADDGDAFDSIFGNEKEERPEPANWQRPVETGGRKVHLTVTPLQR